MATITEKKTKKQGLKITDKRKMFDKRVKTPLAGLYGLFKDQIYIAEGDVFNLGL